MSAKKVGRGSVPPPPLQATREGIKETPHKNPQETPLPPLQATAPRTDGGQAGGGVDIEGPSPVPDVVLGYVDDPRDRAAVSLVCRRWYCLDALTRTHVTVSFCYAASPSLLRRRFPRVESLKAKPRAAMFNLIPDDWGGHAGPWLAHAAAHLDCLKAVHLRRMVLDDDALALLLRARGHVLHTLRLDKCSGFSTHSLGLLARSCRCLRTLFLEESNIMDHDGEWLRELAINNSVLETLNFYITDLRVASQHLELLTRNCRSLVSLKISDCDVSELPGFFQAANALQEFGRGSFPEQRNGTNRYHGFNFPPRLTSLGLLFMGANEMPTVFPVCAAIRRLDLQYTFLSTEDHCQLIQQCPNLEAIEVRDVLGDRGLEILAQKCKTLRRLRIERGEDEQGLEDEQGKVSHVGLSSLALRCPELEYLAVYASDITNAALECFGMYSKKLYDFRFVLLNREERITDLPLDNGVRALLSGCNNLQRFSLYLRSGGLADVGLGYIGEYSGNIRYMLLGNVGVSDGGLMQSARACSNLQKLELRSCCFSEGALAHAAVHLHSLRYLWVQGYQSSPNGRDLIAMAWPYWNIEFIPPRMEVVDADDGSQVAVER